MAGAAVTRTMPAPDDETLDHLLDSPPELTAEEAQAPDDPRVSVMDWLLGVGEAVARKVTAVPRSPSGPR
ncbi:MAG: hypothetical protein H0T89_11760 [Deltaproteobacteria bacterium]|nr:hypothetical protein [Deltaproteobacteria bacterium]MDQ3297202.1 hypothetical protein [Myxococcota bacterium]